MKSSIASYSYIASYKNSPLLIVRVVHHMFRFSFFSLSFLLSFGTSLQLQMLVLVLHQDIVMGPSHGLFHRTDHCVHLLRSAENKRGCIYTSPVQGPPCVSARATNLAASCSDRVFSPLGALSLMVSERSVFPCLYRTYCHTPPQHKSSPLPLNVPCCLATSSKTRIMQLPHRYVEPYCTDTCVKLINS